MTRAKDALHLLRPQRFYVHQQPRHGDRHVFAPRTRFIPDALDRGSSGRAGRSGRRARRGAHPRPAVDLAARMRGMWS